MIGVFLIRAFPIFVLMASAQHSVHVPPGQRLRLRRTTLTNDTILDDTSQQTPSVTLVNNCPEALTTTQTHWTSGSHVAVMVGDKPRQDSFEISVGGNAKLCLDLQGGKTDNGTPIQIWECSGSSNQRWHFPANGWKITFASNTKKCIDAGNMKAGTGLVLWDCNGLPQQTWGYDSAQQTIYLARSRADASKVMDLAGAQATSGTRVQVWDWNGKWEQKWDVNAAEFARAGKLESGRYGCATLAEFNFDNFNGSPCVWYDISIIKGFNYALSDGTETCDSPTCNIGYKLCCTSCMQGTRFSRGAVTFTFCPNGQTAKQVHCC